MSIGQGCPHPHWQTDGHPDERTFNGYFFCKIPNKTLKVTSNTDGMNRNYHYKYNIVLGTLKVSSQSGGWMDRQKRANILPPSSGT